MPFTLKDALTTMRATVAFPPAAIGWNRLEGRPRTAEFERALRAEVRDALWFLTRQWQFGEFKGEDAGSPIEVRTVVRTDPLQHYAVVRNEASAFDNTSPLEARVEREVVDFDLTLHTHVTRYFWQLTAGVGNQSAIRAHYLDRYELAETAVAGVADADAARTWQIAKGRVLNARKLLHETASGAHDTAVDAAAGLTSAERAALKGSARDLRTWFIAEYGEPDAVASAWNPRFLEYQFAVATETADRGQTVLVADQYTQGHLDWFAFDLDAEPGVKLTRDDGTTAVPTPSSATPLSFIPTPVSFGGMPSHRFWEMESRQIEFADVDANTTDVAKLLLTEFALVFGNDWCIVPYELRVGTVSEAVGMLMTDDFGQQSLLLPAGRGFEDRWQRWSMFTLSRSSGTGDADTRFFLAPAVGKLLEAPSLERVVFLRDEMANMAWGVERTLPNRLGQGIGGYDVAARAVANVPEPPIMATTAPVRYLLGRDVPYNWIPFIPVHVTGSNRSVQLQRARMPAVTGAPDRKPLTHILLPEEGKAYYINEEEVPRAGKLVTRSYQRGRWLGGATITWIGRRVTIGRGEGSSALAFDQVVDVPKPDRP